MAVVARRFAALALVSGIVLWVGCAGDTPAPSPEGESPAESAPSNLPEVACTDPRGEVCTFEYNPVCALRDTGVRCAKAPCPSWEWKTYSSPCTACADPQVAGYSHDPCEGA